MFFLKDKRLARLTVMEAENATPEDESYSHRATESTEEDFTVFFVRSVRDLILMLSAWRFIEVLRLSQ